MRSFLVFVFALFSVFCLVESYTITIPPGAKECFYEELHHEDKMTITFQVGDGGHLDIDFWVIILIQSLNFLRNIFTPTSNDNKHSSSS